MVWLFAFNTVYHTRAFPGQIVLSEGSKNTGKFSKEEQSGLDALKKLADGADVVKDAMHRPELEQMGGTNGISFYWGEGGSVKADGQYRHDKRMNIPEGNQPNKQRLQNKVKEP